MNELDSYIDNFGKRYQVRDGSESAHCCFKASVLDTSRPVLTGSNKPMVIDGIARYEIVCECCDRKDADLIAKALNQ